jgi:predicted aspartyl protease
MKSLFAILAMAFCIPGRAAMAADCKPLQYYTGVPMTIASGIIRVPVTVNGKPEMALFDTGGLSNNLSSSLVEELGLTKRQSPIKLLNVSGKGSDSEVRVDNFSIGAIKVTDMHFQVSPFNLDGVGVELSKAFLYAFDVDLDFGSGRINFFLPDHCTGNVIYWPSDGVAEIPIELKATQIEVPVTVDGQQMEPIIDTGTTHTTMSLAATKRLNIPREKLIQTDMHVNGDQNLATYQYRFSTLSFGGVTVRNPSVLVIPDRVNSKEREVIPGSHIESRTLLLPEILIGLDILTKLHIYVSFKEHMLYVGAADDKAGKLLPPPIGNLTPPQ